MRQNFAELLGKLPPGASVLELGSGPGYLAECVFERCTNVESYTLLDFSEVMLGLSRNRLARFPAARFVNADFRTADWTRALSPPYSTVIAMQAVHEVRHKRHAPGLYRQIRKLLVPNGLIAVCDGTPQDGSELWRTSLLMTAEEQLHALASAGFLGAVLDRSIGPMVLATGRR
jgi:cyclopropane fatty-acyl-phospholipid synthase-like methyltransferase